MSSSEGSVAECAGPTVDQLAETLRSVINEGRSYEELVRGILTVAVRTYAELVDRTGIEISPTDTTINTTEAVVTACALLRSQNLNAFDTALWFSRTAPRG